jgi:formylglycine-generating enzyme required for sulfatase activity
MEAGRCASLSQCRHQGVASVKIAVATALVVATCAVALGARTLSAQASRPSTVTNAIGMEFVLVSPGSMVVGRFQPTCPRADATNRPRWTPDDFARCEQMAKRDATPGFTVTIPRPYYIGRFEVTQREWTRVMRTNPAVFQGSKVHDAAERHPVDNVTWADAQAFVRNLNTLDASARYRLPTEFEWEYAARAGNVGEPGWDDIRASAWEQDVDLGTTHPVGLKKANAWGLYDTLGNVWEWVNDVYNEKLFADSTTPGAGPSLRSGRPIGLRSTRQTHVLKGGSFVSDVKNATWSTHAGGPGSGFDVGFRLVRDIP